MSKKELVIGVICMSAVGCVGGVGYAVYDVQQKMNESVEMISQLEEQLRSANEQTDQAVLKSVTTKDQITIVKKEQKEPEKDLVDREEINVDKYKETPTLIPDPTVIDTESPQTINDPDITGSWVDTMSNRTKMYISYRENRPGFDIMIDASDGAVTGIEFLVSTDGYDEAIGGFLYHGTARRYEYNNVSYRDNTLISSDMSGVLKYSNDRLYWMDHTDLIAYQNLEFKRD